jgi:hypothetical protein
VSYLEGMAHTVRAQAFAIWAEITGAKAAA